MVTSRRERKKTAARSRIIEAAIGLFSQRGIEGVTVDQIAEAADVGKGTIYNHFETKEDIVVAFMAGREAQVQAGLDRFANAPGTLASILTGFLLAQFRRKAKERDFVRIFLAQMFLRTEQFFPYMDEMQKSIDPPLETLFRRLQERGLIRPDVQVAGLVLVFKTIHLGLTALWAIEGPPYRGTTHVLKQEVRLFCEGLEAR